MRRSLSLAVALLAAGTLGCGCAATGGAAERPARINHVVFAKLKDPALAPALIADCDARLATIPGVVSYYAGQHIDTGRPTVIADYDVGLYIGFMTEDAYSVYVDHPNHTGLVADWREQLEWLHVYDVLDETD